jgi:hypothetical protein
VRSSRNARHAALIEENWGGNFHREAFSPIKKGGATRENGIDSSLREGKNAQRHEAKKQDDLPGWAKFGRLDPDAGFYGD